MFRTVPDMYTCLFKSQVMMKTYAERHDGKPENKRTFILEPNTHISIAKKNLTKTEILPSTIIK